MKRVADDTKAKFAEKAAAVAKKKAGVVAKVPLTEVGAAVGKPKPGSPPAKGPKSLAGKGKGSAPGTKPVILQVMLDGPRASDQEHVNRTGQPSMQM